MEVGLTLRFLVVDDDSIDREIACRLIRGLVPAAEITECGTIGEAASCLQSQEIDAMIIDQRLPDGDGLDSVASLRLIPNGISMRIILLTALNSPGLKLKSVRSGANAFLRKDDLSADTLRIALGPMLDPVGGQKPSLFGRLITDEHGIILDLDEACAARFNVDPTQVRGKPAGLLFEPIDGVIEPVPGNDVLGLLHLRARPQRSEPFEIAARLSIQSGSSGVRRIFTFVPRAA